MPHLCLFIPRKALFLSFICIYDYNFQINLLFTAMSLDNYLSAEFLEGITSNSDSKAEIVLASVYNLLFLFLFLISKLLESISAIEY